MTAGGIVEIGVTTETGEIIETDGAIVVGVITMMGVIGKNHRGQAGW